MPEGRAPDYDLMRQYLAVKGLPDKYKLYEDVKPLPLEKTPENYRFDASLDDLVDRAALGGRGEGTAALRPAG